MTVVPLTKLEQSPVNTGLSEAKRQKISEALTHVLADSYSLYLKTQFFHWNVTGPHFNNLHAMFEGQYRALAEAVDEIAERIRALGFAAPGSFQQFGKLSQVKQNDEVPEAQDMVRQLKDAHETVVHTLREALKSAEEGEDDVSVDLLTQRLTYHEKTAWMLRSSL